MQPAKKLVSSALYHAVLLTKVTNSKSAVGKERDISRILYVTNQAADSLNVYTISEGSVFTAIGYSIVNIKGGIYLIAKPLFSNQEKPDSVKITFNDRDQSVMVNNTDRYQLYPAYYTSLKKQALAKHPVTAILSLLVDNIGEYPIEDALPLLLFQAEQQTTKHILQAKVVTKRSQADDVTDTWNCTYQYNKEGKLTLVKAASGGETYFSKKVTYAGSSASLIKWYKNIEDRQITNRSIRYQSNKKQILHWTDSVTETGKNLETTLISTLTRKDISKVNKMNASQAEILSLIK
jgi:hypothetical protein